MTPRRRKIPPAEAGFALIEVLVSAAVVVVVSAGTFGLLQAMTRASGEQRHSSQAFAIAQEDQARMRSMQLVALSNLKESKEVKLAGTTFTVRSTGVFVNNKTASLSCDGENISADYAQVTSVVSWPGATASEKSVLRSIVSPTINSIDSQNGTLTVAATNEKKEPQAGIDLKAGIYSAETDVNGCATFPDLPSGTVSLESDGEDANLVSPNSAYVEKTNAGVGAGAAKMAKLTYDSPGTVPVKFTYRNSSGALVPARADSVLAFHSVMKAARVFGTPGGARSEEIEAERLFPFTSPYSVYAGSCEANKPSEGPALGSAVAPAGSKTGDLVLQLPALDLTVKKSGAIVKGATVTISDQKCEVSKGNPVKRVYTTNKDGKPSATSDGEAELGLPWGVYDLCASANFSGTNYRKKVTGTEVKNLAQAKAVTLELTEKSSVC